MSKKNIVDFIERARRVDFILFIFVLQPKAATNNKNRMFRREQQNEIHEDGNDFNAKPILSERGVVGIKIIHIITHH